eukprot:scaffold226796_cov16-Prasinocladus_malaysianus.AAC.1
MPHLKLSKRVDDAQCSLNYANEGTLCLGELIISESDTHYGLSSIYTSIPFRAGIYTSCCDGTADCGLRNYYHETALILVYSFAEMPD